MLPCCIVLPCFVGLPCFIVLPYFSLCCHVSLCYYVSLGCRVSLGYHVSLCCHVPLCCHVSFCRHVFFFHYFLKRRSQRKIASAEKFIYQFSFNHNQSFHLQLHFWCCHKIDHSDIEKFKVKENKFYSRLNETTLQMRLFPIQRRLSLTVTQFIDLLLKWQNSSFCHFSNKSINWGNVKGKGESF